MKHEQAKRKMNKMNILFILGTPIISAISVAYMIFENTMRLETLMLAFILAVFTGLSITVGYHRLLSHRTFEATWPVRLFLLIFGAASFQNSVKYWCSYHRDHHVFVDQESDPYNIKKGFFHAHMGWIFYKHPENKSFDNILDLLQDPLVRFQDRYYYSIAIFFGLLLPMGIAALWGDVWGGFFIAGITRIVFNHHCTFFINSIAHFVGRQPYSDKNTSRDSWLMAFFTYGEGYHNFHHAFQADYRNGYRVYHWDPGKWSITLLKWIGLVKNLRFIPKEKIVITKIRMQEQKLLEKIESGKINTTKVTENLVTNTRQKIEEAYVLFQELKAEYKKLKKLKVDSVKEQIATLKEEIRKTKRMLKKAHNSWASLCLAVS